MIGTQVVTRSEFEAELRKLRLSVSGTGITALPPTSMLVKITRTLIAGAGLTGGGDLSADRTFAVGAGTGIAVGADTVSLSHLGLEALTNPGADRIFFWDNSEVASKWLTCGDSIVITTTTLDTIQDIRTSATPTFAGLYLKSSSAAPFLKLTNESNTARDPVIQFAVGATPVTKFTMGVDDSDDDKFKISLLNTLGAAGKDILTITSTGEVGGNKTAPEAWFHWVSTDDDLGKPNTIYEETRANYAVQLCFRTTARDWWVASDSSPDVFCIEDRTYTLTNPYSLGVGEPKVILIDGGTQNLAFWKASTSSWGTSAVGAGMVGIVKTAPSTSPANAYQFWAADFDAGGTVCPFIRTENGITVKLNQNVGTDASPTFVALNLSATSNQIVLQSAGVTGTITATPASSNKVWTLQNVTGTIYQTGGTDVAVADGGTNKSAWTLYALPYASGTTTIGEIAIGTAGQVLAVNVGADGYTWAAALSNPMTDIGDMIIGGAAGAPAKLADVAVGSYLASKGVTTAPAWATLNQAAVTGLTTTSGPEFARLGLNTPSEATHIIEMGGTFDSGSAAAIGLFQGNLVLAPGDTYFACANYLDATVSIPAGETCPAVYGIYMGSLIKTGLGSLTKAYGLFILDPTAATSNYTAFFEGKVGINDLAPAEMLDIDGNINVTGGYKIDDVLIAQKDIVGLTTASSPTFAGATLTSHLLFSGAANRTIQHSVDDQSIYVNAGSVFTKGASIQFYGEDHASYPGDAYIIAGSSDRAALGSIVELAFRDAGTYRKLLTLTYAATPVGLLTGSFQCTTGFGCNSKTAQTAYASGGPVTPGAGAYGYSSAVNAAALATLVTNIRTALVNVGIMS